MISAARVSTSTTYLYARGACHGVQIADIPESFCLAGILRQQAPGFPKDLRARDVAIRKGLGGAVLPGVQS